VREYNGTRSARGASPMRERPRAPVGALGERAIQDRAQMPATSQLLRGELSSPTAPLEPSRALSLRRGEDSAARMNIAPLAVEPGLLFPSPSRPRRRSPLPLPHEGFIRLSSRSPRRRLVNFELHAGRRAVLVSFWTQRAGPVILEPFRRVHRQRPADRRTTIRASGSPRVSRLPEKSSAAGGGGGRGGAGGAGGECGVVR
jgi:hypothetical protein